MKKSTAPTVNNEPMGIVIAPGVRAPIEPLVRAYVWGEVSPEPTAGQSEKNRAA